MKTTFLTLLSFLLTCFLYSQNNADSLTTVVKDIRIDKLQENYKSNFKLVGYRIQIYSGNKRQPANQARATFLKLYRKKKAHMNYEQPYYKVRVGDFKTKLEALNFKNELIKHFPNCFIVKDELDIDEVTN